MKLFIRILAPLMIVAAAFWTARYFVQSRPEPSTFATPPQVTQVEATRLRPTIHQIYLPTQGSVRPRTTTTLIPEVSGRVVEISPNFREGGFFKEGEMLLRLDRVNYETALVRARSETAQAARELEEEKVRAAQAVENWRRLGRQGEPGDLASRRPQLAEAEARLAAAEAGEAQAKRDLERTEVKAPFDGRILEQQVDVGQFVTSSTLLGRAFATDVLEVRLPLTNRQLSFVDLPDGFIDDFGGAPPDRADGPEVLVTAAMGRYVSQWTGKVVRVDSTIDESSRQLFVVAEIDDPYRRRDDGVEMPLKIGMFVDGLVKGVVLEEVFVLPRQAVRVGGEVIVVEEVEGQQRIRRQQVDPVWTEEEWIVIPSEGGGLSAGEVVCLTPLAYPVNGAPLRATIDGVAPETERPGGRGPYLSGKSGGGRGKGDRGGGGGADRERTGNGADSAPAAAADAADADSAAPGDAAGAGGGPPKDGTAKSSRTDAARGDKGGGE